MTSGTKVAVTGGCGFLGSHLVDALAARGHEITVLDGGSPPPDQKTDGVHYVPADVRDPADVTAGLPDDVEVVYHLAAVVGVDRYLDRPLDVIDINLLGTRNVLERASRTGARVVVASTSEVFGKNPAVPWAEDADRVLGSTSVDRWCYSSSKALAEHLVFGYVREKGLNASIVRYFNVYGPRQRPAFVVSRGVHRALNGLPPVLYDDGGQTRCFTYVQDAIDATIAVAGHPAATGEAFNVGSHTETSVGEVTALIAELTGAAPPAPVATADALGARYQDLRRRIPDTRKIGERVGWTCSTDLRDGLAHTIDWARRNPWWLAQDDSGLSAPG
ncbi:NAD-dependent epimerase/dehydratase family protein [Actinomadura flavalba]|uniref:NAD-dependent epimerase/dehydratase family protein n=1 Tax=Actinomadura flavalba TaxID=1120938 RepID=UPI000374F91F|nr:NAD-dependent epimerase/dehydratase family protein [Actinomadura flavalba]